jgi:hypothetical protein
MPEFLNPDGSGLVGAINPSGVGQALQMDASGNLKVTGGGGGGGSNASVGSNGAAIPTSSTLVAGSDGANLQPLLVESASNPNLRSAIYSGANKLAIDALGRLTLAPNQAVNIAQWNGAAPSLSNPVIDQDQIRGWILNGQGFSATTGKLTAGGSAITGGLSVFNPAASGKTLLIYSIKFMIGSNNYNQINLTTADPALGTAVSAVNMKAGSSNASVASCSSANTTVTPAGTMVDMTSSGTNFNMQALSNGQVFVIPAGNGLCFYSNVAASAAWYVAFAWIEF